MESEEDLNMGIFGTPLKPLDEDDRAAQVRQKPIAIQDQIVTDEKGRRRFHGAFTGGFSAGYFNTAGSRDGWTPKTFKSSRSSKTTDYADNVPEKKTFQQRPEEFMDDEDMAEFGIAPKKLQASSNFFQKDRTASSTSLFPSSQNDDFEKRNARLNQISEIFRGSDKANESSIPMGQPVLEKIFVSVKETIGVRLLREMGWKPGQGIGPRITRRSKRLQKKANRKMFEGISSVAVDSSEEEEGQVDELASKYRDFLFAPDDISSARITKAKDNLFGIAYQGLDRNQLSSSEHINLFTPVLTVDRRPDEQNKKVASSRRKIAGQAFGVGVYEEEDEDIYAKDDVSRYDFYLDSHEKLKHQNENKKRTSRWNHDELESNTCLAGFVPAKTNSKVNSASKFPPPELPKNYRPRPIKRSRFEPSGEKDKKEDTSKSHAVLPSNATAMLSRPFETTEGGEMNVNENKETVANSKKDGQKSNLDPAKPTKELHELVEMIQDQHKAASLLQSSANDHTNIESFKPYAKDPMKQKRYEQYLICLKNGRRDALPLLQPKGRYASLSLFRS